MAGVRKVVSYGLHLLSVVITIVGFNIDTKIPVIKKGPPGSYFGFSIAQHQSVDTNQPNRVLEHLLLVGAPKNNVPAIEDRRTGAFYKCNAHSTNKNECKMIRQEDDANALAIDLGNHDQWFGGTVKSQELVGNVSQRKILVCAHRYKKVLPEGVQVLSQLKNSLIKGICYTYTQLLDPDKTLDMCEGEKMDKEHQEYGFCQAGVDGFLTKEGAAVIGAPGAVDWTGVIFAQNVSVPLGYDKRKHLSEAGVNSQFDKNSYIGWSVTAGKFDKSGLKYYLAGSPKVNVTGQVIFFTVLESQKQLRHVETQRLGGEQDFSGFGFDILAVDLNSDGYDDLVVGAPFYTDKNIGGAIYVYLGGETITKYTKRKKITSRTMNANECEKLGCQHARFGFSLAKAGDLNRDGYEDIVVGAPYEGKGAIYVFHGSADGAMEEYSQRIYAEDLNAILSTFGYSLSGGRDLDENGYSDISVGAYESDTAILLRTRPIIHLISDLNMAPDSINMSLPKVCSDSIARYCLHITLCLKFTAEPKDRFTASPSISYKIESEPDRVKSRVEFKDGSDPKSRYVERQMFLHPQSDNRSQCQTEIAYLKDSFSDKLKPIEFSIQYWLPEQQVPLPTRSPFALPDINEYPILDTDAEDEKATSAFKAKVEFVKDCGDDKECESNLVMGINILEPVTRDDSGNYVLNQGIDKILVIDISIANYGESAYETKFYLNKSEELGWQDVETNEGQPDVDCDPFNATLIHCPKLGNPLKNNEKVHFRLILQAHKLGPSTRELVLVGYLNTTSKEINMNDDYQTIRIRVAVMADLYVDGGASPEQVIYSGEELGESAMKYESMIGPAVNHTYDIGNNGPGTVSNIDVEIHWPYEMASKHAHGEHLLYLMQEPQVVKGRAECQIDPNIINILAVKENPAYVIRPQQSRRGPVYTVAGGSNRKRRNSRRKRDVEESGDQEVKIGEIKGRPSRIVKLGCKDNTAKCHVIKCKVKALEKNEYAVIVLRARLWQSAFVENYRRVDEVRVSSYAQIFFPEDLVQEKTDNDIGYAVTIAVPDVQVVEPEPIKWWIILVAVLAGLVILIFFIILLWKLGFFKRKRLPDDAPTYAAKLEKEKDLNNPEEGEPLYK